MEDVNDGDLEETAEDEEPDGERDWQDVLKEMQPAAFERLAKRLLREAGFINVQVTGGPKDGCIDGTGVYKLSLVSFPVHVQSSPRRSKSATTPYRVPGQEAIGRLTGDHGPSFLLMVIVCTRPAASRRYS